MPPKTTETKTDALAPKEPVNVTVKVAQQVRGLIEKGALHLPRDYSPENALKSAYLALQEVRDSSNKLALESCTQVSIMNALFDMVVQGLNPAKKQCYFIVYGQSLNCQRSYFGDMALAQRACPGIHIYYNIIYERDELVLAKHLGRTTISRHETKLENIDGKQIAGAYCGVVDAHGEDLGVVIMAWEQITKSWSKSKTYKLGGGSSPHHEFPDQMALRTVIRRRLKPIINASSDEMLMQSVLRQELDSADAEIDAEIEVAANARMLPTPEKTESLPDPKANQSLDIANYEPGADDLNETAADEQAQESLGLGY